MLTSPVVSSATKNPAVYGGSIKYICVASSGRTEYFAKFLQSLAQNSLDGWRLLVTLEPKQPSVTDFFFKALENFPIRVYSVNHKNLGACQNTFNACNSAMSNPDCEALVYFDDDMVLSPDALELCNWYLERPALCAGQAGLCLCTDASDPARPNSISFNDTWRGLVGQGYCYTRKQWEDFVKPEFFSTNPTWAGHSYDWALCCRAQETGRVILRPRLSRTQHIGVVGLHGAAAGVHTKPFPEHISTQHDTAFVLEHE